MDLMIKNSSSHVKDFQTEDDLIPVTPEKPTLSPICSDSDENQSNLTALVRVSHESLQGVSFENSSSAGSVSVSTKNLAGKLQYLAVKSQLSGSNDDFSIYNNFYLENVGKQNIRFQDLLAMLDAAAVAKKGSGDENGGSGSFSSFSNVHEEENQVGTSPIILQRENHDKSQDGFQVMGCTTPDTQKCGLHIPPSNTLDLNLAPGTMSEADIHMSVPSQFTPVTPDLTRRLKSGHISDPLSSSKDERTNQEKEDQKTESSPERLVEKNCINLEEQSGDAVSMQLSDKGVNEVANLNKTTKQKPRRRKYTPKVVREDKPKRTRKPRTPKPDTPNGQPTGKRKYVRKKGVDNPAPTSTAETNETNDLKTVGQKQKTCRRSINFDTDNQMNEEKSTVQLKKDIDRTVEKTDESIDYELIQSIVLESKLSVSEKQANCPLTPNKSDLVCAGLANNAQSAAYRKGKCRIHFSDETHDKETSFGESPNNSSCSISAYINNEKQDKGTKRKYLGQTCEMKMCTVNSIGAQYNSCQAYLPMFPDYGSNFPAMHFPVMYKERTEKGQHLTTQAHLRHMATGSFSMGSGTQDGQQSSALDYTITYKRKRIKGHDRVREQWPTPSGGASGVIKEVEPSDQPHTCVEDIAANIHVKLATRKRAKRNSSSTSMPFNPLYHHQSASDTTGFLPHLIWKSVIPIDVLINQFEHLDINAQTSEVANQEQHSFMQYYPRYQDNNGLVLYQQNGTLVTFDNSFNQMRRRKPRPRVDLDDETTRVWKLLLEDINSEGIDGTHEEKAKWWEEERRVFRGRADSFIARMHLVQGDRRFSRWKGSVVDSVVGVFLTQNVSDHLSSSAFMSLAARFPLNSDRNNGAETSISVREPDISQVDPNETIRWHEEKSNQTAIDQSLGTEQDYFDSAMNKSELSASFMEDHKEVDDVVSSQNSVVSSQNSLDSLCNQNSKLTAGTEPVHDGSTFMQKQGTTLPGVYNYEKVNWEDKLNDKANSEVQNQEISTSGKSISPSNYNLHLSDTGNPVVDCFDLLGKENVISTVDQKYEEKCASEQSELSAESVNQATVQEIRTSSPEEAKSCNSLHVEATETCSQSTSQSLKVNINQHAQKDACKVQQVFDVSKFSGEISEVLESTTMGDSSSKNEHMENCAILNDQGSVQVNIDAMNEGTSKAKRVRSEKPKENVVEWDSLRHQARNKDGKTRGNTPETMDSLDYEAVRCANVNKIADAIKERGMNNRLAERIQAFLNRLVKDHGSIDLEWLRDVPPDKAKEYLLSFRGLGLKSVECVRLLCLHHLAFPVDTNVGRIAVRLGWVPLQPLPESLQLHLLELYPILESIQKYLWPRLCKLDQRTLYELHYQMITFGKVFCTKNKPNCNACPMRGECRHFASAFASARLSLPAPEEKSIVTTTESKASDESPTGIINEQQLPLPAPPPPSPPANNQTRQQFEATNYEPLIEVPTTPGPIIEVPTSPEQEHIPNQEIDIEDSFGEDPDEIPTIKLNIEEFTQNLQNYMETNMELQDGEVSKALVALTQEAASIPTPKLKNVSQLRTEHQVYELPDSHPLLKGLDKREHDDPCSYLLAIWTPGETADSLQPPAGQCGSQELGRMCDEETCFSCNSAREANSQTVRGTLLIPCRTAMRGSFPLNGTYFQVNEVFADHDSSLNPIDVPRSWLWNLPRRTVFFGTSIPTIFKGLTTEGIQYCFWRGFVCVRGIDLRTRAPRPLIARLHFPASKFKKTRGMQAP